MKQVRSNQGYRFEDLVEAAYNAAQEATADPMLATIVEAKVLEDWFKRSGRTDLVAQLRSALS